MVLMPPGYAKTLYTSILFPAWFFAQEERLNIIGASYASGRAEEISGKIQGYIRRNTQTLGYALLTESVERWTTTNGGMYVSSGVTGGTTGYRSNLTIIDDPIKDAIEAESITRRDTVWDWYLSVVYSRKKALAVNRIVLVQTRWNEDDLAGRLLQAQASGGDEWVILRLPAICDSIDDPLERKIGEALWPENEDLDALEKIRKNTTPYFWGSLYQQDPKPRGASFFNLDDLLVPLDESHPKDDFGNCVMKPVPWPKKCDTVFAIIDTAIKSGQEHNATAVTFGSYDRLTQPTPALILDWDIVQIEGAGQADWLPSVHARGEELARQCGARMGYSGALIEDKATGTVLLQQSANLARAEGRRPLARPIDSKLTAMGKEERAIAAAPYVSAGRVKLTEPAFEKTEVLKGHSANHFVKQVTDFRLGTKQKDGLDLLDTFVYLVLMSCGSSSGERKGI
jgi:hypothetical protein